MHLISNGVDFYKIYCLLCFPGGSDGKESACKAGDLGLIPEFGRSPGEGNGNLRQYSRLDPISLFPRLTANPASQEEWREYGVLVAESGAG